MLWACRLFVALGYIIFSVFDTEKYFDAQKNQPHTDLICADMMTFYTAFFASISIINDKYCCILS